LRLLREETGMHGAGRLLVAVVLPSGHRRIPFRIEEVQTRSSPGNIENSFAGIKAMG
jgi:hypothetical protein